MSRAFKSPMTGTYRTITSEMREELLSQARSFAAANGESLRASFEADRRYFAAQAEKDGRDVLTVNAGVWVGPVTNK